MKLLIITNINDYSNNIYSQKFEFILFDNSYFWQLLFFFLKKTIPQIVLNDDPYVYRLLFPTHLLKYFQKQDGKE